MGHKLDKWQRGREIPRSHIRTLAEGAHLYVDGNKNAPLKRNGSVSIKAGRIRHAASRHVEYLAQKTTGSFGKARNWIIIEAGPLDHPDVGVVLKAGTTREQTKLLLLWIDVWLSKLYNLHRRPCRRG